MKYHQKAFSPAVVKDVLSGFSDDELQRLSKDWPLWARSSQLPPEGDWRVWLLMAGRGFGKTRTGAEWVRHLAREYAGCYIGLVGASFDDVRHVMIEGPSGILSVCRDDERPLYLSSKHQLRWQNGTIARAFAADTPSQLRGPEFHFAWADEIAKWRYHAAWDNLMLALRAGECPRILATTTPRPLDWLMTLAKAPTTKLVTGKTDENQSNLAPDFVRAMYDAYGQSDLARQELGGELLDGYSDALWSRDQLAMLAKPMPKRSDLVRVIIGVDPAIGGANETGIIIAGKTSDGHLWVLADHSQKTAPHIWAKIVRQNFVSWRAEAVVVEVNQGGDLVDHLLRQSGVILPLRKVRAFKSKYIRAEPVAAAYARGQVSHAGVLPELVDQMVCFSTSGRSSIGQSSPSPDRLDAAVWALTALLSGTQTQSQEMRF
ncbi:MAG: terminase large subunit domain-containing protein [Candidatus Puniceispirillaceae bacterium]